MSGVNNHDLINELAIRHGLTRAKMQSIYSDGVQLLRAYLKDGHDVTFNSVCYFQVVNRGSRKARNPRTGETFMTEPKAVVKIRTRAGLHDLSDAAPLPKPEDPAIAEELQHLYDKWIDPKLGK